MKQYLLLFFALFVTAYSWSQDIVPIKGTVENAANDKELENVNIVNLNKVWGATTNEKAASQNPDPQIFENTWYLNILNINSIQYSAPSNDEVQFVSLEFSEGVLDFITTTVCLSPNGDVSIDANTLVIDSMGILGNDQPCENTDNLNFENLYLYDYFRVGFPEISNPIDYEIITDGEGNKQLTLTNINGDTAIYGSQLLFTKKNELDIFSISDNPVQNILELNFQTLGQELSIQIYDLLGKLHFSNDTMDNTVFSTDVSQLQNGVYLVIVTAGNNRTTKKFIKK